MDKTTLTVIIPCYNEEEGLENLTLQLNPIFEKLNEDYKLEAIFVDDGSTDRTNQLLHYYFSSKPYVIIINHPVNMNLGAALRTGFNHATGDIIVTMDSDCTYDPTEIFNLLSLLDENTDIVTASPYHPQGKVENIPPYRLFLSKSICFIYRLLTRSKIYTFTALFRAHRKEVVKKITFTSTNFLATAEIIIYSLMNGYTVKEYPTTLHVRQYGVSKMKLLLVIKSHTIFVFKLLWMRITGKLKKSYFH